MSATLDNERLRQTLPDAPMISSEGRAFPVERRYQPLPAHQRFDEAVAIATAELLRRARLAAAVLPGVGEIQRVQEQLASRVNSDVMLCRSTARCRWLTSARRSFPHRRAAQSGAGNQYRGNQFDH